MTQDEILEMVREAGGSDVGGPGWTTWVGTQSTEFLERFARLVAAKTLAQTQEPVAWVSEDVCKGQYIDGRPRKIWWECEKGVGTAFYTAPPQRTWVGLTDEQIAEIENEYIVDYRIPAGSAWNFAKDIEAKLKEKNT